MNVRRVLTGITTTGTPHLGNYAGMYRPAIKASRLAGSESYFFLADLHALVKCDDPARVQKSTLEVAATWLACGLDPEQVYFYRQSAIPEIPERMWMLTCVTGKGLLNRAHAYKAQVDQNVATGEDPDAGVTAGLYMYPVLMAADILAFNAHEVPVGRDQIQHIEMARDIAQRFNHLYGGGYFTLPEARIDEQTAVLPGLDGRKMSKSYNNTIPLFDPPAKLRKLIAGIVTDSKEPGQPKDPDESHLYTLYSAFADPAETQAFRRAMLDGIAWGDAKQALFEVIDRELRDARERYEALIAKPSEIELALLRGAEKAREKSRALLATLREAVGLRPIGSATAKGATSGAQATLLPGSASAVDPPRFVSYREKDAKFYFKLLDGEGKVLLQSDGYGSPKEAGQVVSQLKSADVALLSSSSGGRARLGDRDVGTIVASFAEVVDALARIRAAELG